MLTDSRATQALMEHSDGDPSAASRLLPLVYDQLRALAGKYMQAERPDHTLQPTALVHEAYLRLIDSDSVDCQGKTHFIALAATQMRRILIEHARSRKAAKRGGGAQRVTLRDAMGFSPDGVVDMLHFDEALKKLTEKSGRMSRVVELRYFGGLTINETAMVLGVSTGTVKGDWRMARAWLARELSRS